MIDAEKFNIRINTNEGTEKISGYGYYPADYQLLKEWISDLNE